MSIREGKAFWSDYPVRGTEIKMRSQHSSHKCRHNIMIGRSTAISPHCHEAAKNCRKQLYDLTIIEREQMGSQTTSSYSGKRGNRVIRRQHLSPAGKAVESVLSPCLNSICFSFSRWSSSIFTKSQHCFYETLKFNIYPLLQGCTKQSRCAVYVNFVPDYWLLEERTKFWKTEKETVGVVMTFMKPLTEFCKDFGCNRKKDKQK